jgi:hypothetical protein
MMNSILLNERDNFLRHLQDDADDGDVIVMEDVFSEPDAEDPTEEDTASLAETTESSASEDASEE